MGLVMVVTFCKLFPYNPQSSVLDFCAVHKPEDHFDMYPAVYTEEAGAMSIVKDVLPLRKWALKVKRRAELEPKE